MPNRKSSARPRGKSPSAALRRFFFIAVALAVLSLLLTAAGSREPKIDPYYLCGTREQRETFRDLYRLLEENPESGPERFAVILEIAGEYGRLKEYGRLVNFLEGLVRADSQDPYAAWYLLMTAAVWTEQGAPEIAAIYYDMIVKNYPDLRVRGEQVHFIALSRLITIIKDQRRLVWYYEELLDRFPDRIDPGQIYFLLGQAREKTGDWNAAMAAYSQFIPYYGTVIQGFPDAYTYAKQLVDFNRSPKDWTFESLPALVQAIREALQTGNDRRLRSYRAKVNFFDRSWGQEEDVVDSVSDFDIAGFMRGNQIRYAPALDPSSTATEAYLRTWGWSLSITTWYLYFRKINFPSNPEIHGRWEWAGVYYGEKW